MSVITNHILVPWFLDGQVKDKLSSIVLESSADESTLKGKCHLKKNMIIYHNNNIKTETEINKTETQQTLPHN